MKRKLVVFAVLNLLCLLAALSSPLSAAGKTVRLFSVGNSFSNNATYYLADITKAAGNDIVIGKASCSGCSLQQHWNGVLAAEANPDAPEGKLYGGKTLREAIGDGNWDIITIQQASPYSYQPETFQPFANNLYDYLKKLAPNAEIVVHQTWAYRADEARFHNKEKPFTQQQMYEGLTNAYHTLAGQFGLRVIPVGDAFYKVDSDPVHGYKMDGPAIKASDYVYPQVPEEPNSLHTGWYWRGTGENRKFARDPRHAGVAGQYLGALVWYEFLFGKSVVGNSFVPKEISKERAAYLQQVAHETVSASPLTKKK